MAALCLLALALLGRCDGDGSAVTLRDGVITPVGAGGEVHRRFEFTPIDRQGTLTVSVFPNEGNTGTVMTSICTTETCEGYIWEERGFFSSDIAVSNSRENGDEFDYDLTQSGIYIDIEGGVGLDASIVVMSSPIIMNTTELTISEDDDYDYQAHDYMRFYRVFLCDTASARINLWDNSLKVVMYVNGWDTEGMTEPGRPGREDTKHKMVCAGNCAVNKIPGATYPGWVFIGIDFKDLFTYVPEEGGQNYNHSVKITTNLENYLPLDPSGVVDFNVCMYEGCNKIISFEATSWASDEEENETFTLTFVAMSTESYEHEHTGLFMLEIGDVYPTKNSKIIRETVPANAFTIDEPVVDYFLKNGEGYMTVSMAYGLNFPQPPTVETTINVNATILKNSEILGLGGRPQIITLKRSTQEQAAGYQLVDYYRLVLDTSGFNKPSFATTGDTSNFPAISSDYFVVAKTKSSGVETNLKMGAYIGPGEARVPYLADVESGETNYLFESKLYKADESEEVQYDFNLLRISSDSKNYHMAGAYILDVYNTNIDNSQNPQNVKVEITAYPGWKLHKNILYKMDLNGLSTYDFFVIQLNSLERGFTFSVKADSFLADDYLFNIYASFMNGNPDFHSKFSQSGYGRASLLVKPEELKELEEISGDYYVFIEVDTRYSGEVELLYTEGNQIQYDVNEGNSIDVRLDLAVSKTIVGVHSYLAQDAEKMLFYYSSSDKNWPEGTEVSLCILTSREDAEPTCLNKTELSLDPIQRENKCEIKLTNDLRELQDFYIYIEAEFPEGFNSSINITVFAQKMSVLSLTAVNYLYGTYISRPMLLYLEKDSAYDYTLDLSVVGEQISHASYLVRSCADYPAISKQVPEDVDSSTNVRKCITESLDPSDHLIYDLVGESLFEKGHLVDDVNFASSSVIYISILPQAQISYAEIHINAYEDDHHEINTNDVELIGEYDGTKHFRLHLLSADQVNYYDKLSFSFAGSNPMDYCLSLKPHVEIAKDNCIFYYLHDSETEKVGNFYHISESLGEINPDYLTKNGAYFYFAYRFPDAVENDEDTLKTLFSNTIIHFLPKIKSETDDLDVGSYFFNLRNKQSKAFYTKDPLSSADDHNSFTFYVHPQNVLKTNDEALEKYARSLLAVQSTTDLESPLPRPDKETADIYGAGIIIKDYDFKPQDIKNREKLVIIVVKFAEDRVEPGMYKAGFIAPAEVTDHALSEVTTLELNEQQEFSNNYSSSSESEDDNLSSALFYYPHAVSTQTLGVFPCAGEPVVYQSYVSGIPKENGDNVTKFPALMKEEDVGKAFMVDFKDSLGKDINSPTGFMFNATAEPSSYRLDPSVYFNIRWDAEVRLVSDWNASKTGGPTVLNDIITLKKSKGSELTLNIAPAFATNERTYIDYAVFALPVAEKSAPYFDASPYTYCGLKNYGFPLTYDSKAANNVKWVRVSNEKAKDQPNAQDNEGKAKKAVKGPNDLTGTITLTTNFKPSDHKGSVGDDRANFYQSDGGIGYNDMYNVNVIAREVSVTENGETVVVGYTPYAPISLKIAGNLPVSEGGMFGWEIFLIVLISLVLGGGFIALVVFCVIRKRRALGYTDIDGQGSTGKGGAGDALDIQSDNLDIAGGQDLF